MNDRETVSADQEYRSWESSEESPAARAWWLLNWLPRGRRWSMPTKLAHEVLKQEEVKGLARERWGEAIFAGDGEIDRQALGGESCLPRRPTAAARIEIPGEPDPSTNRTTSARARSPRRRSRRRRPRLCWMCRCCSKVGLEQVLR